MKLLPFAVCCLLYVTASVRAQVSSDSVVASVQDMSVVLEDTQFQFLPVSPPSDDIYIHPIKQAFPLNVWELDRKVRRRLIAQLEVIDGMLFPIYTVYVHEDPDTWQRVFYNSRNKEITRIDPPAGYYPYTFALNLFDVDDIAAIDPYWLRVFSPAHIALELKLVPEVFYPYYLDALAAERPEPPPPAPPKTVTQLQVSLASDASGPRVRVEWPAGYTDLIDVYSTTNLVEGSWELAAIGLVSDSTTNLHVLQEGLMDDEQRYFQVRNGSRDSDGDELPDGQEVVIYKTDPNDPDGDGDGILDGDETHGDSRYGDQDGFKSDPFWADRTDYVLPAPAVAGPGVELEGFAPFDPNVVEDVLNGDEPEISEWTRFNQPGDTMVLTGERLSDALSDFDPDELASMPDKVVDAISGRDTRFLFYGQNSGAKYFDEGQIQRLDGQVAALTLPETLPPDEMYLLWAGNKNGWGSPVAINKTEPWWAGPDIIAPGEMFHVYGKNLVLGDGGECRIYVEELGEWLTSSNANAFKADFVMPDYAAEGTYTFWTHNGHGQEYGWGSQSLSVDVKDPIDWNAGTIYNVKDYGAAGDGVTDDFGAISSTIDAAGSGDTVYFPEGTYLVAQNLVNFKPNQRMLGEGGDKSVISSHPDYNESSSSGMIHEAFKGAEFRGLGFLAGDYNGGKLIRCRDSEDVKFYDCTFSQLGAPWEGNQVDLSGSVRLSFERCDFIVQKLVFLGTVVGGTVKDCNFYGLNDTGQLLNIGGADNISITGCTGQHYDNSDWTSGEFWSQGRFIHGNGDQGASRHLYMGENQTFDLYPRYNFDEDRWSDNQPANMNTGEQIMFEYQRSQYRGTVVSATETTVECVGLEQNFGWMVMAVVKGRGMGQSRYLESVDADNGIAVIDEPWQVIPDSTSEVLIGTYVFKAAMHGNVLDGAPQTYLPGEYQYEPETYVNTASAGVSLYGSHLQCVVANNRMSELESGMLNWSIPQEPGSGGPRLAMPNFFNQYMDNSVDGCMYGIGDKVYGATVGNFIADTAILGTMWRNNVFTNITDTFDLSSSDNPEALVNGCVLDGNTIVDSKNCSLKTDSMENRTWVGNKVLGDGEGSGVSFYEGHVPALRENTWSNYVPAYSGDLPGAVLEAPIRVVEVLAASQKLQVWNSGTDSMTWIALEASPWLTLTGSTDAPAQEIDAGLSLTACAGVMADEKSTDTLYFDIDQDAAAGPAYIVLLAEGQGQVITVLADGSSAATVLYNTPRGLSFAEIVKTWLESDFIWEAVIDGIRKRAGVIPDWTADACWKDQDGWQAWQQYWDDHNDPDLCSCWTAWETWEEWSAWVDEEGWGEWINNETNRTDQCDCWLDWTYFQNQIEKESCLARLSDSQDWRKWRKFWSRERNWDQCICWEDWQYWETWKDYWGSRSNWHRLRSWEDWKESWIDYLTERKLEELALVARAWMSGDEIE